MRKGVVELVVLAALTHGEAYGYEILQRLQPLEGMAMTESTVYPVLARLTRQGLLSSRRAPSPKGPPRRYYQLTPDGRQRLDAMWAQLQLLHDGVDALIHPNHEEHRP
ncbi:MAG: PadR family transcriptional regulator [Myxococcales bacterium]|nr:PadR family transcriptional regulator [Myxococcales bacterium]